MNAVAIPSKLDRLRERDGDSCWLCLGKLDFAAVPNSKKAPTKEHLIPRSDGGTDTLDNLVLCHPGCNKQLGNRPKADKLKMREKRQAARAAQLAKGSSKASAVDALPDQFGAQFDVLLLRLHRWQFVAMTASVAAAFFAGLAVRQIFT